MEWRPIETAPKDGTRIVVLTKWKNVRKAEWKQHNWLDGRPCGPKTWWRNEFHNGGEPDTPLYWIALPPLPSL